MGIILFSFLVPFLIIGAIILPKYFRFRDSTYQVVSGNSFIKTIFDKGNYGEFLTFIFLEKVEGYHKLLTNLYIPKKDGSTTEIDLVMLSQTGIYVFESKNYSGWIFGDEKSKNWMQTLESKQKNSFYNPIWQNKGHINALKPIIEVYDDNLYKSYIVFSERCTIKKMSVTSSNVKVLKRNVLTKVIKMDIETSSNLLNKIDINRLYVKLQQYVHADETIKKSHVDNIHLKRL